MLIISEGDDEDDEVNDNIDKDRQGSNLSSSSKNNRNQHREVEDKENGNHDKDTQHYDDSNDVDDVIITDDVSIQLYLEDEKKEVPKERRTLSRLSSFRLSVESSMKNRLSSLIDDAHTQYTTCDLPATWVNWLLCFTFGIQTLTIGYTYGIGPIFIRDEFDKGTDIIGILFSIGATFGSISAILVTCTSLVYYFQLVPHLNQSRLYL